MSDEVTEDLTFEVKVTLRLEVDEVRRVLAGRRLWEKDIATNAHFDALVEFFDTDTDLWEAYYIAAFDALAAKYPLPKKIQKEINDIV
jgi:hypothetical protein